MLEVKSVSYNCRMPVLELAVSASTPPPSPCVPVLLVRVSREVGLSLSDGSCFQEPPVPLSLLTALESGPVSMPSVSQTTCSVM